MSERKTLVSDFHSGDIMLDAKKKRLLDIFSDLIETQFGLNGIFDGEIVEIEISCKLGKLTKRLGWCIFPIINGVK